MPERKIPDYEYPECHHNGPAEDEAREKRRNWMSTKESESPMSKNEFHTRAIDERRLMLEQESKMMAIVPCHLGMKDALNAVERIMVTSDPDQLSVSMAVKLETAGRFIREKILGSNSTPDALSFEVIQAIYAHEDRLTPEFIWVKPKGLGYTPFEYRRVRRVSKEDTSNYPEIFKDVEGDE